MDQLVAADADGRHRSAVLERFWLQVDWQWQVPLPRVRDFFRKLEVI